VPKKIEMPSDQKAHLLLDAVEDRKAIDPVLLDLRGKTLVADFFLICTGNSNVHIRAIAELLLERADENLLAKPRVEGLEIAEWVLLDFGDVVIHVMAEESRERYKLEQFWTTPQPKGALPPTPGSVAAEADEVDTMDEDDLDDEDLDDEDAAFFDEAEQELEPLEDDEEIFDEDDKEDPDGSSANRRNGLH